MRKVPFYKPTVGQEEIDEVVDTLKSGWLTTGPKTKRFEADFAAYLGHKHAIAVNSCTAALHLALEALGVKSGDTVVVPTMTFAATAEVGRYLGARPLLVDCQAHDFNMDVEDAARRIQRALDGGQTVRAILPVHYGGQVGDAAGVKRLAERFQLKIVEDAAHCCPAYYRYRNPDGSVDATHPLSGKAGGLLPKDDGGGWISVGSEADISCYSFYANKTITTGEGGMACTADDAYADRMRIMSLHGISRDAWKRYTGEGSWYYEILAPGFKYNLTDVASAIGLHQLRRADAFRQRRAEIAARYQHELGGLEELLLPTVQADRIHSWHLYVVRLRLNRMTVDRGEFIAQLQKRGIGTSVHWMPLHMHPYYRETYGYNAADLPVAASLYPELVSLPIYPEMTDEDVDAVCDAIREILGRSLKRAVPVATPVAA